MLVSFQSCFEMSPRRKIIRNSFLTLDGTAYSFEMTDRLDHNNLDFSEDDVLTKICETISDGYKDPMHEGQDQVLVAFDKDARKFPILPDNVLTRYLDETSRRKVYSNWLIFRQNGNHLTITHFGAFGSEKDQDFIDTQEETMRALAIYKQLLEDLKSPINKMSEEDQALMEEHILAEVKAHYFGIMQNNESQIQTCKKELEQLIYEVYDEEEDKTIARNLIAKLSASTGKVLIKTMAKVITEELAEKAAKKVAAKLAAKAAAKLAAMSGLKGGAAKGSSKVAAKAVPFVGAAIGVGFGLWRLSQGDVLGAGLEIASGAASCVPGAGTAVSLAIDGTLVGKDMKEALEAETKRERNVQVKLHLSEKQKC